ncbi:NAD(P)-dependent dehydrogenase, short-chain alcohol dehydrogenase family [Geoalkalibacter ferrihydriticus]|uniref:Oxidoreductase n=2 Tax=Geoalkalibacter ferrihydriticus TaxID=392333 RepID=A0A0C2EBA8_9BACT|nr:SDR family oxidoreductase [Geoalkalibacter ferrihydriticus]KIH75888.1 oxidoreductase [Geoalkalibacter ferrihydriticus DSM 17813]SDM53457.1 NAD(P)-dependent dehydrogenase, short-chain alcohol dehydrogenase family [Geoalkalibacter ferrihydriticus]
MNKAVAAAIITGAARGIGRAVAEEFLRAGYQVMLADLDEEGGHRVAAQLAEIGRVEFVATDVSQPGEVERLVTSTAALFGGIDVLVNNAGIMIRKPLEELSFEEWQRVLAVNLTGPFLCARAAAPHLRARCGAIINIASTRALMSELHTEAYSASKGGLLALTHALALSLGPEIRVNGISPGWIDVSAGQEPLSAADHAQHPAGRVGTPQDIARAVLFLADPANDFITGENLVIDGGMTRKMIYV